MATSATYGPITWAWTEDRQTGTYLDGSPWVIGPITITSITPASTIDGTGRTLNGSMVNPPAGMGQKQGFDSSALYGQFNAALNAARPSAADLGIGNPLVLAAGNSLISSVSYPTAAYRPQLTDVGILTVVSTAPAADSFRPPYVGADKSAPREVDLDYSVLPVLPVVAGAPSILTVADGMAKPWVEIDTEFSGRELHPSNHQPNYGREMTIATGNILLCLCLNYTPAQKRIPLIRIVQYAIDVFAAAKNGGVWIGNGGHNSGRKGPLLFAGLVLHRQDMLDWCDAAKHKVFQEDGQTFYVAQADVNMSNSASWKPDARGATPEPYTADDIGMAEWDVLCDMSGQVMIHQANVVNKSWDATYRWVCTPCETTQWLAARLVNAVSLWNWQAGFDYADRAWAYGLTKTGTNAYSEFLVNMWNAYRYLNETPTAPSILAQPSQVSVLSGTSASFTVSAQGSAPLSYQWNKDGAAIAGATARTYTIASVTAGDVGSYTVTVTNAAGSVTSNSAALLTIDPVVVAPTITSAPTNTAVSSGAIVSWSVTATGTAPLSYQWFANGNPISGATSATYVIPSATVADSAIYSVNVGNSAGWVGSAGWQLTVSAPVSVNGALIAGPDGAFIQINGRILGFL